MLFITMRFKLVRVDAIDPYKVSVSVGSHAIGRGKLLDCNDNRVSRNHAELIVSSDSILLKSLHQNPCFLKKKSSTETIILSHPDTHVLCNGDQFGLVPDSFWYEVIQCTEDSQSEPGSITTANEKENPENQDTTNVDKNGETQIYNDEVDENEINCSESLLDERVITPLSLPRDNELTTVKEPENGPMNEDIDSSKDRTSIEQEEDSINQLLDTINQFVDSPNQLVESTIKPVEPTNQHVESTTQLADSTISVTPTKRAHSEENSPCHIKRVKTEPESPSKDTKDHKTQSEATGSNQAVKTEPSSPQANPGCSNNQGGSSDNCSTNSSAIPPSATPPNKQLRERCMYGANCYRRNPQHKAQFSHPTDPDWGLGERGVCPWGASCQRADPRHWRDHEHPPGVQPPAPRPRGNRPGRRRPRPRSATPDNDVVDNLLLGGLRVRRQIPRQEWSDSDDEFDEDPFQTDESDEWEPDDPSQDYSHDSGLDSQNF